MSKSKAISNPTRVRPARRRRWALSLLISMLLLAHAALAEAPKKIETVELDSGTEADVRIFPAGGDHLLLGFACDQGTGLSEEHTAALLAEDGVEVWMPDMLTAYMVPNLPSSIREVPGPDVVTLIEKAHQQTGKKVYLIAAGTCAAIALNGAEAWEKAHGKGDDILGGMILLFPRLNAGTPEPGEPPVFVDAVGKTAVPIYILEGERTPNRWAMGLLAKRLSAGGSQVFTSVIPDVRGYFYNRQDANMPEEVVSAQLSGMIKASLYTLNKLSKETAK
jgi:hypothetical protein